MVVKKDSLRIKELKHKARRLNIKEGIFAAAKTSFGDYYIPPFAIALNASSSLVAMLSSISGLLGSLTQVFSSRLIENFSRKKIILKSVFFEALMWLPLILIAFLFYNEVLVDFLPLFLLLSFSLYIILANIGTPALFSWMGDIIDEEYRGRWFSKRNLITGFVSIVLAIFASFFLNYFEKKNIVIIGFAILFFLAFVSRMTCWKIFKKQYEPKLNLKKGYHFSFWDFLINAPKTNFGRFAIFRFFLNFAVNISSPLIAVYLLRNLNFDYFLYIVVILSSSLYSLVFLGMWGKFADMCGNYKILGITSLLIPIIPILWIISPSPIYLILVPALVGGVSWAGFNLAAGNFIYDNVTKPKRGLAVSYYNMLNGIGIFLGAGLGALLIKIINVSFIEPILLIFFIGGIMRMIVVFFGLLKFKEIRKFKKFKSNESFKTIFFKQAKPTLLEEVQEIISIKEYLRE